MQITKIQFRRLVLLQLFVSVLAAVMVFIGTSYLPAVLQEFFLEKIQAELTTWDLLTTIIIIPFIIWWTHNLTALYRFKKYAPKHLLYVTITGLVIVLMPSSIYPLIVATSLESVLTNIFFILVGSTLALVYFSNIATEFINE